MGRSNFAALSVVLLAAGCRPTTANVSAPPANATDADVSESRTPDSVARQPAADFEALEMALLSDELRVEFTLEATGVIQAKLRGVLRATPQTLGLQATGSLSGQVVELEFTDDGKRMRGRNGERTFDLPHEPGLRDAIGIGIARMGLLHNVAVLIGGRPPDHAIGGVRDWAKAENIRYARAVTDIEVVGTDLFEPPLSFELQVGGRSSGSATLWFDPASSLPSERHQIVEFPEGQMRVRETYAWH